MDPASSSNLISPSGLSISELPRLMARQRADAARDPSSASVSAKPTTAAKPRSTRAERACYSCHKRKIRCDVVKASPCSNRKVDKLECTEREGVRSRRKTAEQKQPPQISKPAAAISSCTTIPSLTKDSSTSPLTKASSVNDAPSKLQDDSSPSSSQSQSQLPDNDSHNINLPHFLYPIPREISAVDAAYLGSKGAFMLPPEPLQNGLLQSYVEYVHPYMPAVDLEPLLKIIQNQDGSKGRVSLLFYHSVMLAASAFVDINLLVEAGCESRKTARKTFFERARLLYDFDYEKDCLTLVQSVLLLTYWHDSPDGQKDLWYWMGIAISAAHSIDLHKNPETMDIPLATKKLRKRVWWSCFIRDRLIALGARKPSRISENESYVPMLVETDFDIRAVTPDVTDVAKDSVLLKSTTMQRDIALMCIAKAELCVHLGHALDSQYVAMNNGGGDRALNPKGTRLLYPNKTQDSRQDVAGIDEDLQHWLQSLPEVCQNRPMVPSDAQPPNVILTIQRAVLHQLYQTTVLALYRPQSLNMSQNKSTARKEFLPIQHGQDISWYKVHDAAAQITNIVSELAEFNIDKLLPTTCVILILPAMIIQVLEMKDEMAQGRDQAFRSYNRCMHVMEHLRESFYGADFAITFLNMVLMRAGINLMPTPQPATMGYGLESAGTTPSRTSSLPSGDCISRAESNAPMQPGFNLEAMNLDHGGDAGFTAYMPPYMDTSFDDHDAFGWNMGAASDLNMTQIGRFMAEVSPLMQRNSPTGGYYN